MLKKETAPRAGEGYSVEEEKLRQTWDWALKDERTWIWGEGRGVTPDRLATCLELWRGRVIHACGYGLRDTVLGI